MAELTQTEHEHYPNVTALFRLLTFQGGNICILLPPHTSSLEQVKGGVAVHCQDHTFFSVPFWMLLPVCWQNANRLIKEVVV